MDDAEAGRLVVQGDAKIDKFVAKANEVLGHAKKTSKHVEEEFSHINVGKALESVFDRSKLTVIDAAGEHLSIFGSALEHLGPAGIAAGAGVAALGLAVEQAHEVAEWAENIHDLSDKLGVTTDALQEFDYAALQTGVSQDVMRESLSKLTEKIGMMQSGIAGEKIKKVFEALDITPQQLRRMGDMSTILPMVIGKLAELPAAERAALSSRLDIAAIDDVIRLGKDGFAASAKEAHEFGVVIDADVIAKGDEASRKLKIAGDILDKNLKGAFLSITPAIADASLALAKFLNQMGEFWNSRGFLSQDARKKWMDGKWHEAHEAEDQFRKTMGVGIGLTTDQVLDRLGMNKKPGEMVPDEKAMQMAKESRAAIAKADKEELTAREALTTNLDERLRIAHQLLDSETKQQLAELKDDVALKKISAAAAARASVLIRRAAVEKAQLLDLEAQAAAEDRNLADKRAIDDSLSAMAKIQASMALTLAAKRDIEERDLRQRQRLEMIDITQKRDREVARDPTRADYFNQLIKAVADRQAAERAQLADQNQGPLAKYIDQLRKATGDTQTAYQNIAVRGLDNLNTGLTDAIVNSKNLGQVFGNVAKQIEADLVRLAVSKYITLPLANMLGLGAGGGGGGGLFGTLFSSLLGVPHMATGGLVRGGMTLVGENGPELVNLPTGARVTPNDQLRNLSLGRVGAAAGGALHFHLEGAVVTQDLVDQMNAIGRAAATHGATMAVAAARQLVPQEMNRRASLQIR